MPLWQFTHTPNTFSPTEKKDLAQAITSIYSRIHLPAFYVNVQFFELAPQNQFVGGESPSNYTAISIYHIARSFNDDGAAKKKFMDKVDQVLGPRFGAKGMSWEYFIQETPVDLWRINGRVPPEMGSEMERVWARENKPVEVEGAGRENL